MKIASNKNVNILPDYYQTETLVNSDSEADSVNQQILSSDNSPDMNYLLKLGVGDENTLRFPSVFEKAIRYGLETELDYLSFRGYNDDDINSRMSLGEIFPSFKALVESEPAYQFLLTQFPKIEGQRSCTVFKTTKITAKKRQLRLIFASAHKLIQERLPKQCFAAAFMAKVSEPAEVRLLANIDDDGLLHISWWNPKGESLDEGAFSRVLPSYDLTVGKPQAVKIAIPGKNPKGRDKIHQLLRHEAALLAIFHETQRTTLTGLHEKVISIISPTPFFDGWGLVLPLYTSNFTKLDPQLPKQQVWNGLINLLKALKVFKELGYFHGDVKRENILVRPDAQGEMEFALSDVAGSCKVRDMNTIKELQTTGLAGHRTNLYVLLADRESIKNAAINLSDPIDLTDPKIEEIIHLLHLKDIYALSLAFQLYFQKRYRDSQDLNQSIIAEFGEPFARVIEGMGHEEISQRLDAIESLNTLSIEA